MAQRGALAVAPTRRSLLERVQLDDRAVGFVGENFRAPCRVRRWRRGVRLRCGRTRCVGRFEAEGFQQVEQLRLRLRSAGLARHVGCRSLPRRCSAFRCRKGWCRAGVGRRFCGSSCLSEPAAALRGLANISSPADLRSAFNFSKPSWS